MKGGDAAERLHRSVVADDELYASLDVTQMHFTDDRR